MSLSLSLAWFSSLMSPLLAGVTPGVHQPHRVQRNGPGPHSVRDVEGTRSRRSRVIHGKAARVEHNAGRITYGVAPFRAVVPPQVQAGACARTPSGATPAFPMPGVTPGEKATAKRVGVALVMQSAPVATAMPSGTQQFWFLFQTSTR